MNEWEEIVRDRLRRKNTVLFRPGDACLAELRMLLGRQNGRNAVLWAFGFAQEIADTLAGRYPGEKRPENALAAAKCWAFGEIKMQQARRAILGCHALAKEVGSAEDSALCHALAQACSAVHTPGHAMGLPVYELTALVHRCGLQNCAEVLSHRVREYTERLLAVEAGRESQNYDWADFMRRRV